MITAWNKIDACPNPAAVRALAASRPDVVAVSGATGEGLNELLELVALKLAENMVDVEVRVGVGQRREGWGRRSCGVVGVHWGEREWAFGSCWL